MAIVTAVPAAVVVEAPKQTTPDDPAPIVEEVEGEPEDIIEDEFALMVLKVVGAIVIFFSIIELGVGGSAFGGLSSQKLGGWWIALLSVPAGIGAILANKRLYVTGTVVLAVLAAVLSFISTVIDGTGATTLHNLVTCASLSKIYGKQSLGDEAYSCLRNFYTYDYTGYGSYNYATRTFKVEIPCSCVMEKGNECYNYKLSYPTTTVDNCGELMTSFPRRVDASTVFSFILLLLTIALSTVGLLVITCPAGYIGGLANREKKTEEVPDNTIIVTPDNGLVGVNGNTDAV